MQKKRLILFLIAFVSFLSFFIFFVNKAKADIFYNHGDKIDKDTTWSGRIYIKGTLNIERGVVLTITPGSFILFEKLDIDKDGVSESLIKSAGVIRAIGTEEQPIMFSSAEKNKQWGDWKEIQINHVKALYFKYCIFEYSEYGLHIHFSDGHISHCIFRKNADGTRIGNSRLEIRNNLFENNSGKAINFTSSDLVIENNTITNNRNGMFVFEKTGKIFVENNNIYNNFSDIQVGDFFQGQLILGTNFLTSKDTINDKRIKLTYVDRPFFDAIPHLKEAYVTMQYVVDGFVDGEGKIHDSLAYLPSFGGFIYEIDLLVNTINKIKIEGFTDSAPVVDEDCIYYTTWDGEFTAIKKKSKELFWNKKFIPSLKDDHRMASPILIGEFVVGISQGGNLLVINKKDGKLILNEKIDGEFRATPLVVDNNIIYPSTNGLIAVLDTKTLKVEKIRLDGSFYSSPIFYEDFIYLLDKNGLLYKIDKHLNVLNKLKIPGTYRYQSPVVFKDSIFVFSLDGYIIAIKDRVEIIKRTDYIFSATPIVIGDVVVVPTFQGDLFLFNMKRSFSLKGFGEIQFKPLSYKNLVILGTRDNKIYVLRFW